MSCKTFSFVCFVCFNSFRSLARLQRGTQVQRSVRLHVDNCLNFPPILPTPTREIAVPETFDVPSLHAMVKSQSCLGSRKEYNAHDKTWRPQIH